MSRTVVFRQVTERLGSSIILELTKQKQLSLVMKLDNEVIRVVGQLREIRNQLLHKYVERPEIAYEVVHEFSLMDNSQYVINLQDVIRHEYD